MVKLWERWFCFHITKVSVWVLHLLYEDGAVWYLLHRPAWGNMTKNEFTLPCNFTYNVNFRHVVRYELAMPCRSRNSWWQTRKEPEGSSHFSWTQLLFCVCVGVLSGFNHFQLFATPMDCSLPGSSVHGILQARILESVAISSSRGSSWPRDWTYISYASCISRQVLYY